MTKAPRGRPRTFDGARALRDAEDVFRALGFYAAYGSKEQLFREAVELYSSTLGAPMIAALAEQPTAGVCSKLPSQTRPQAAGVRR